MIGTEAIRQPEVRVLYESEISTQKETLEVLLSEVSNGRLSPKEIVDLASIVIAAMEGSYQLSVATKGVMPTGYAAPGLLRMVLSAIR